MEHIRIGAFDQSPLLRAGIIKVLEADAIMEVVAEAGSAMEALRLSTELAPDVVVLDANLLVEGDVARMIAALPGVKLLILSSHLDESNAAAAFMSGARGYVLKEVQGHEFREAVRAVYRGEAYVSPALAGEMMLAQAGLRKSVGASNIDPIAKLTHREGQIFELLAGGLMNREIAIRLEISEKTVKRYVTRIFETLGVRNRVEAAILSRRSTPDQSSCHEAPNLPRDAGSTDQNPFAFRRDSTSIAQCFSAVFGLTSRYAKYAQEYLRTSPVGTHIFLKI
jgi:DNA-binding NarL/FixJ family response regulator